MTARWSRRFELHYHVIGIALRYGAALVAMLVIAAWCVAQPVSITPKRIDEPIALDGKLDEPAWREAQVLRLIEQSPRPGQPMPYETEVRVLVSHDALYFG